ncbi:putative MATE family efflux protein [Clostridium acetobutylicum]|uniref:Multidrug export protein MepA n=1 Tax=Clostridium acetobutylicum (strain ATCC 824 / DSM 792 / JCM 1419 / IAM 19013 / LMG 5710 / NBRC 13948 / NRRL B-527 / VKM B-1787 / 2291 / W) TaxID=272562 RepID=Q97E21_CLOAB|nr:MULTISPECIES: MATE family efflux transporter [Clostridium]AAK81229.1 Probable cation efflux pump (multidrug resistance protein) [Clostridium acetobutylicum ATCC 824]ADZ22334.1 putative cation efflux pump (multidrug resistance protein) [Clostridium acetobutylicum EA 2018]AEI34436.1 cation efflux pump (multidrug resistance protein) [Clostridium acetobutylicum DSM 1731]AWV81103.1 MATE family efflux transporter [Clostridium acetobutylicum]MBC2395696.1 MATE family efflux transporter [Clostridium
MTLDNRAFLKQSSKKLLFRFAVPAIFSLLVNELYNMVDTVFAGRYIGENAIGAMTIAFPIQKILIAMGLLIATGASTYAARVIGEKNYKELKKIVINSCALTIVSIISISFIIFQFKSSILYSLGASDNTYPMAVQYISIILFGSIFMCLASVMSYIMVSLGKTKTLLYTNIVGVLLNIILNYVLVIQLHMGIRGSGIATVLSQLAAFVVALVQFAYMNKKQNFKFFENISTNIISGDIIREIVLVGFSTFIIEIADAVVSAVLNNVLYAGGGDSAIIMLGVITKVYMFMFITVIGISSGMQPIVGYNFGAGNYKKAKDILKFSLKTVIIISAFVWVGFIIWAQPLIGFFLKDAQLVSKTVSAFRIVISMLPLLGIYYVAIYYYQAIGEARISFILSIYRELIMFIPMAVILFKIVGINGVFIAYPLTDIIVILTSVYFIRRAFKEQFAEESIPKRVGARA